MGNGKFRHTGARKPLNRFRWNLEYITCVVGMTTVTTHANPCGVTTTWVVWANTWHVTWLVSWYTCLGRLLRVDLIKWISNVKCPFARPFIHPSTKSFLDFNEIWYVQYDARDKYPSGVVSGRTVIESVVVAASADGESGAKVKRIARKTRAICCEPLSREMTFKKSLSGVKDKTMTDNTCLLYERIRWAFVLCISSIYSHS